MYVSIALWGLHPPVLSHFLSLDTRPLSSSHLQTSSVWWKRPWAMPFMHAAIPLVDSTQSPSIVGQQLWLDPVVLSSSSVTQHSHEWLCACEVHCLKGCMHVGATSRASGFVGYCPVTQSVGPCKVGQHLGPYAVGHHVGLCAVGLYFKLHIMHSHPRAKNFDTFSGYCATPIMQIPWLPAHSTSVMNTNILLIILNIILI